MSYASDEMREQLARGPYSGEDFFRMQVTGNGKTRWVNVTPEQLARIADGLDTNYREYDGPFDPLPRDIVDALAKAGERVLGWRHLTEPGDEPNTWRPRGYLVITTNGRLEYGLDGIATRDGILWAPPPPEYSGQHSGTPGQDYYGNPA